MRILMSLALFSVAAAQNPALAPTADLVLDTTPTQGVFAFSSIAIPAGVRVSFSGTYPVRITCDGNASIDGRLDVDAGGSSLLVPGAPGAVRTGAGASGSYDPSFGVYIPAGSGVHAGSYGSAVPFSLAGGSPGGDMLIYPSFPNPGGSYFPGGGGGGTLVVEAAGRIDVRGRVSAGGGASNGSPPSGRGSGGSILLRGLAGVTVHASGTVSATGSANGFIRLDSYAQPPSILGTVQPAATRIEQPNLTETAPAVIGSTWQMRVIAPRGDGVFLAASFQPGSTTSIYGTIGIDLASAVTFAVAVMPTAGHDPMTTISLPVPNVPALRGLQLWIAGIDWVTQQPQRYTNTLTVTVQ